MTAPILVSPKDGTIFYNFPRVTTLQWQPVSGATSYNMEIQCDTCSTTPWATWRMVTVTTTSYTFTWVGDNHGRWRVTPVNASGTGPTSGFFNFSYITKMVVCSGTTKITGTFDLELHDAPGEELSSLAPVEPIAAYWRQVAATFVGGERV